MKKAQSNPYRFLGVFIGLFCVLYFGNKLFFGITSPGNYYFPWLDQHLNYIKWFRHFLLASSSLIARVIGYEAYTSDTVFYIKGHSGIVLVYSCLGFGVMSFFAAFVLAWPKPVKEKVLFLMAGIVLIQGMNIMRFVLIAIYGNRNLASLPIDHHSLFNIILYLILLGMIYWWVNLRTNESGTT